MMHPTLAQAFLYWLKLGFISFGGPAGQIAMMHTELVEKRRWISEQRFLHALNYCMLLPGPEAIQLAIYISWLLHGVAGAIVAGVLFFLPGFLLLAGLAAVYLAYGDVPLVAGIFYAIKPAVVAVVLFAAWRIGKRALNNAALAGLSLLAFVAMFGFAVPFPWIIAAAAVIGWLGGHFRPVWFQGGGHHASAKASYGPALIDDDTPPPPHARFSWLHTAGMVLAFVAIWAVALWSVASDATLLAMGDFFTGAAFLTIGGAYAVLPYVYQGAVEQFAWLTGPQMMDGLALGETTPGPLIMVVTWVGYLGGGFMGAVVATFFTFLPSFLFILVGGPLVESTRNNLRLTAPLSAITAAVVGVILNLATFFAWHSFWPQGTSTAPFAGGVDPFALVIALSSAAALWRGMDILRVIAACALLGLGVGLFGVPL